MERKYKAFISYRHADLDSAVAKTLHSLIEQYKIPKALRVDGEKKMGIVFRDEEELSATNDLTDKIYTALDNSEHLIVICTKATLQSPWVTKEVEHFLKKHDRDKAHIILADGEPMEVFPRPLTHTELENGMIEVTEPMAVDVRAENIPAVKKRIKSQVLRLFAAMLGCPYDALALREQHRKRRRFAAVMSVILAIAVGFSAVLLVKNRQIDLKNEELDSANTALEAKNEELDKKNEELEEKNSQVLLRESELLTANANEAYREGDNYTAIANSASALPTKNDPRPYYAPAESALLTALSPFDGKVGYIMRDTVLEQSTPVKNFRISADGTKLATIDLYSVVNIFDTVTGEILNSVQLNTDSVYLSFTNVHLLYCPEADCVIAFDGNTIAAVSFETCDILWSHSTSYYSQTDFICPSADGSLFAYVRSAYDEEDKCTDYELVFLSGATGEIVSTSKFIDSSLYNKDNYKRTAFKGQAAQGMYNGRFSSDNTLFATTFFSEDDNGVYTLHYSVTDIASGTSEIVCSFEVDGYYTSQNTYFLFFDTNDTIVSVRNSPNTDCILQAERIDMKSGRVLWRTDLPKTSLNAPVEDEDSIFCFTSGIEVLTAYTILSDNMYVFDTATGDLQASLQLPAKIVDADVASGSFVYVSEDGHYSKAILSVYGISDMGDSVDLGDTYRMRIWNGGPTALSGGDESDAGYLATISTDNTRSVVIKRVSLIADLFPYEVTNLTGDAYYSSNHPHELKDGSLALGPFFQDSKYFYKIINPDTGEFIKDFPIETGYNSERMLFLPDGSGILNTDYYGDVTLYKEDGTSESLYDAEYTYISFGDTVICDIPSLSESAILSETGDVLTAVCTTEKLILWTNAENKREIPLPEDLNWLYFDGHAVTHYMSISPDGRIFISASSGKDEFIDRLAVYNIVSGSWSYFDLGDIRFAVGFMCFSETSYLSALLDDDGNITMYDASGNVLSQFSLQLPANSIEQMTLILDDKFIMVKTTDLQVLIYDTATGDIVYRETEVSTTSTLLYPYHDPANNRLYIATGNSSNSTVGLCVDIGSWTTLARINGLVYFNEDTLEMLRVVYIKESYSTDIARQTLPPTEILAQLAKDFLGI